LLVRLIFGFSEIWNIKDLNKWSYINIYKISLFSADWSFVINIIKMTTRVTVWHTVHRFLAWHVSGNIKCV